MTEEVVLGLGNEAIKTMLMLAGPMLVAAMVVGILISVIQAITQIHEATLTFIPKILAVVVALVIMAPWMMKVLETYTVSMLGGGSDWIR